MYTSCLLNEGHAIKSIAEEEMNLDSWDSHATFGKPAKRHWKHKNSHWEVFIYGTLQMNLKMQ